MIDMQDVSHKQQAYQDKKNTLAQNFQQLAQQQHAVRLQKDTSNLFRSTQAARQHKMDVRAFNHVINVDPVGLTAEIEGMTPYSTIVAETLKYHCLPVVVPELNSITIGGALTGVGIEASSFRYGFVHDGITEFEVLTGDGQIITCTADNAHSDLFYAFPNSYGTLGYALKVTVKLIQAGPYVKLTHHHFEDPTQFFAELERLCLNNHESGSIAFIEGVIFEKNELVITTGEFVDQAPFVSNYRYMKIYYQSLRQKKIDYLTTEDYIWRWDTDWFWCSRVFYMQNPLMRLLFGKWMLKSTAYWQIMNFFNTNPLVGRLYKKKKLSRETVCQDVLIPIEQSNAFLDFFEKNIGIKPIWICPYMAYNKAKPYDFFQTQADKLYLDFGFWDSVPSNGISGYYNRMIEKKVSELSGIKSLYSEAYYPEEEFWQIYDRDHYQTLKDKYDPNSVLNNFYNKCVLKS